MTTEGFSSHAITKLSEIPTHARVHVIGVCSVAMAQIACLLVARGYRVSGSDKEFYDPMGSLLRRSAITLHEGYRADHVPQDASLVVIGNSVPRDNPEVIRTQERGLPYTMFPPLLYDLCIAGRHSLVVAGTHGKTTSTACGAYLLERMELNPSYFIGGEVLDLKESLVSGNGAWSIVEGDEYDSAFFAKVPKFYFYGPHTAILTSIEFDHADIYQSVEEVDRAFDGLVERLGAKGTLVACVDDSGVQRLLDRWKGKGPHVKTYGTHTDADVRLKAIAQNGTLQELSIEIGNRSSDAEKRTVSCSIPLAGQHNARNVTGILAAFASVGLDTQRAATYLKDFRGVRRRQEIRVDSRVTLIEDFAHHPTAVRETISAIRSRYPGRRLWAVFEPRSNTSRRRVFQREYEQAFHGADVVVISGVPVRESDHAHNLLSVEDLAQGVQRQGITCQSCTSPTEVRALLLAQIREGDVVLLMSNGAFGNLPAQLTEDFQVKFHQP